MSDPTARRGDNIMALLKEMTKSKKGWPKREMLDFLFVRYRGGVPEQTLESIFNQLKDRTVIQTKPTSKSSNTHRRHVNEKRLREPTAEPSCDSPYLSSPLSLTSSTSKRFILY